MTPSDKSTIANDPTLTVAIATFGDRLTGLTADKLRQLPNTRYLIFVQNGADHLGQHIGDHLVRDDIEVIFLETIGVAQSRNAAIATAQSDLIIFADDDLEFFPENYPKMLEDFQTDPYLDFACCRLTDELGALFKSYPKPGALVSRINSGRIGTPEIVIRRRAFEQNEIRFDPNFGAGSALPSGDEYIFVCDALKAGLRGRHFAIVVAAHHGQSTGHTRDAASFEVREKVLRRALSPWSWPFRVAFAVKHRRSFPSVVSFVRFMRP